MRHGLAGRSVRCLALALLLSASALAQPAPSAPVATSAAATPDVPMGPVPAWAEMLPPAPPTGEAIDIRLFDIQFRFAPGGHQRFQRTLVRANSAEALQVLGRMVIVWDPVTETPIVHKLVVHRGGETIDVLARQSFSVLRREQQLEAAVVNGQLTGFLQITDLRVGDEIEFLVSVASKNPLLGGHVQDATTFGNSSVPTGRARVRATWPAAQALRWQAGPALPVARDGRSGDERWMSIDATGFRAPVPPADGPGRYAFLNLVRFSDFADWQQLSAVFTPLYDAAAVITPGSPLAAEADRIAAASADPRRRAELALTLVQTQVRYVANVGGLGGYKPASAESVWQDRFGDCKGKTVLLLALLRRLGIAADPALVALANNDGIADSLPMPARFDHVIVRAHVAGQTFWLDGTRLGDTSLDRLPPPDMRSALPLTVPGSALVALPPRLPTEPFEQEVLVLEQGADLSAPASLKGSLVLRGDVVPGMAAGIALMGPERAREQARKFWQDRYEDLEIASAEILVDKTRGEVRIETTGKLDLEWSDGTPRSHVVMGSQLGVNLTPKRTAGPFADAPVAVREQFEKTEVTLVLPSPGFVMTGDPIDTAIAGIRYVRRQALTGNRLTMTAETRAMAHEISLAEAKAADVATDTLWDRKLRVKAPEKAVKDKAVGKTVGKTAPPKTAAKAVPQPAAPAGVDSPPSPAAQALFAAAGQKTQDGAYDEALALLDGAGPEVPRDTAWTVMRVLVLLEAGRTKEADRVSETALAKAPRDPALLKLRAQVLEKNGRYDDALILLDRLTVLEPDNAKTFAARGDVRRKLQDYEGAIADYDVALQLQPQDEQRQFDRINVYIARRDWPGAMKASDAALAVFPDSELLHATRAFVLVKLDRGPEARAALERSLAIEPNANAYALRSFHGLSDGPQTEISDWEAVIRLEPGRAMTPALAKRLVAAGGYDRLAAAYQAAHAKAPTDGDIIVAASVLHDAGDKPDATLLMLDTAMALDQKSAELFNESCWIRATRRMDLAKALAACDAALALKPKQSAYLDSRGLVRLQMGQYDKALADYDASLADEPGQTTSMYGRGLARMMLKQPGWEADIAAARKGNDGVDADYASFKLPFALPPAPPVAKAAAK